MKIAHFELIIELEEVLEKRLRLLLGQEYSLFLHPEGDSLKNIEENGQIDYSCIEIYYGGNKYSTQEQSETFWKIIATIEEEQKINEMYKKLENDLIHSSPELFKEEIEFPKKYHSTSDYIVTWVFVIVFFIVLFLVKYF